MSSRSDGLHRLSPRDRRDVLTLLRQRPEHNVYLLAQIARGALVRDDVAGPLIGWFADGRLEGVCVCGSNLVVSSPCTFDAIEAFAAFARNGRYLVRVVVGLDEDVDTFMELYGRGFRRIRLERAGQILFTVTADELDAPSRAVSIRAAELVELEAVIRSDRDMVVEELGFDPFETDLESYREGWRRRIRELRTWVVGPVGGPMAFKMEQSAVSDDAVQISGVYTHPQYRRRGLARDALGQMCERILLDVPRVTLYVASENTPAVRLYESLGFQQAGVVRSVWFDVG